MNQHEFIVSNCNYSLVQSPIDERSQLPSQPLFSIRINNKHYLTFIALRLIFINTSRLLELKALLKERKVEERYMETSFQYFFYTFRKFIGIVISFLYHANISFVAYQIFDAKYMRQQ
jgi:hypothetical protein